jgi:hypothetical protein
VSRCPGVPVSRCPDPLGDHGRRHPRTSPQRLPNLWLHRVTMESRDARSYFGGVPRPCAPRLAGAAARLSLEL